MQFVFMIILNLRINFILVNKLLINVLSPSGSVSCTMSTVLKTIMEKIVQFSVNQIKYIMYVMLKVANCVNKVSPCQIEQ